MTFRITLRPVTRNGISDSQTYDSLNRLLVRTYPAGGSNEQFGYTPNVAAPTSYTNQLGNVTRYAYDAAGRLTNVVAASGTPEVRSTSYAYTPAGDLRLLNDGGNHKTSWGYDAYGRLASKTNNDNVEILRYQYDPIGRLTNAWSLGGTNIAHAYDRVGNLTHLLSSDFANHYAYDALNRLTNMVDAVGTTSYGYDSAGFLQTEGGLWPNDTVTITHTNQLRASLSLPGGTWNQTYGYDNKRLKTLASPAGTFTYSYPTTPGAVPAPASPLPGRIDWATGAILYGYDSRARLNSTSLRNAAQALDAQTYIYNPGSQRTNRTDAIAGNYVNYGYDALGQLTSATGRESSGRPRLQEQWGYQYDPAGNVLQRTQNQLNQTFAVNNTRNQLDGVSASGSLTVAGITKPVAAVVTVNQQPADLYRSDNTFAAANIALTNTTLTAVATDAQGNSASNTVSVSLAAPTTPQYDQNGNLKADNHRIFAFDSQNQLVSVVVTNSATNSTQSGFIYDGKMRRRIRTEAKWGGTAWVTNQIVRYIYDGNRVLQERDGNNNVLVTYTRGLDLSQSFEGAGGIGGLLARTHSGTPSDHHFYYHSDGNGNVTAIMNQSQTLVAQYHYDPFGNLIAQSGPLAEGNLYRFSSKEFHQASGLYYYGYRFYDPNLQRWLNRDPIGERGGINLYGFEGNDPINEVDPLGLDNFTGPNNAPPALTLTVSLCGGQVSSSYPSISGDPFFLVGAMTMGGMVAGGVAGAAVAYPQDALIVAAMIADELWSSHLPPGTKIGMPPGPGGLKCPPKVSCLTAAKGTGQAVEGFYESTAASGKTYVGQSGNIATRLEQHVASGKLLPGTPVTTTEVLGGKTAREIAEQLRINELGGVKNLENIRNPIGPNRQHLLP